MECRGARQVWDECREEAAKNWIRMPMMRRALAGFVMTSLMTVAPAAGQDWVAGGTEDGVVLAFRDVPHLRAREIRAIAELPHPAGRIVAVVCDFTQQLDPDVREATILSGDVNTRYSIYLRYAPRYVVVAARDVVIDVRRQAGGCSWSEEATGSERRRDTVRMPLLRGSWSAESLGPSSTRVTYQIAVNPGGRIPKWLVRRGAAGALPDVIKRVSLCLDAATAANVRCPVK
jgi:hypothetical protein